MFDGTLLKFPKTPDHPVEVPALDVFGKCSSKMTASAYSKDRISEQKDTIRFENYRFYLAFENSECAGYITEKFFRNALSKELVPVVMGPDRKSYENYIPADAFIHVDDFGGIDNEKGVKGLADRINYLLGNDTAYLEYSQFYITWPVLKAVF